MKFLFLKWDSFAGDFILEEWKKAGYECVIFDFPRKTEDTRRSEELASKIAVAIMNEQVGFVFSLNYFPTAAIACKACRVKYISWTYDSPYIQLYSRTIEYDTNYAFVFDSSEYGRLKKAGCGNVYFLPMGAPVEYYDSLRLDADAHRNYDADVAMIGSMYTEKKHQLFRHLEDLDRYTRGYLDALMEAQKEIYGTSVLETSLTKDIIKNMQKVCPMLATGDGLETVEWVFANYFIARKLTSMERQEILQDLSREFQVTVYTPEATPQLPKVSNRGEVDYYTQAPLAMKCAKINLNITLRSIINGIPLRIMDILGAGGFLLTNYQGDMMEFFEPDKDFVYYENRMDLREKIRYYLEHEDERKAIALSGHAKMEQYHSYRRRIQQISGIAGV